MRKLLTKKIIIITKRRRNFTIILKSQELQEIGRSVQSTNFQAPFFVRERDLFILGWAVGLEVDGRGWDLYVLHVVTITVSSAALLGLHVENQPLSISSRAERGLVWIWGRITLRNWLRRFEDDLLMELKLRSSGACWTEGDPECLSGGVFRNEVSSGRRAIYGRSGVANVTGWSEWCESLKGGAQLLGPMSSSWWGSNFDHYNYISSVSFFLFLLEIKVQLVC